MAQMQEVRGVATNIRTANGVTAIRYHSTDVVSFDAQEIVLDSGGYRTVTTKTRMNQAAHQFDLGFQVYQLKGCWYVSRHGVAGDLEFKDGMRIKR